MALRINLNDIQTLDHKNIFVDTNIWLYLFGGLSNVHEFILKKYTRAFKYLIGSRNKLFTDITVLSEYINRCLRHAFSIYKVNNEKGEEFDYKKDYRETQDYREALESILSGINHKILRFAQISNIDYTKESIEELIANLGKRSLDFNDAHIEKLCRQKEFILLTDDKDFSDSTVVVISGNPKFFSNRY